MKPVKPRELREYVLSDGKSPYREWLARLDTVTRARIQARVLRFETGNLGNYKSVGAGVYEARLDFGPGYRIYFGFEGAVIILLLCGGSKRSQSQDIKFAQRLWNEEVGHDQKKQ